jgi:hypothetical protein
LIHNIIKFKDDDIAYITSISYGHYLQIDIDKSTNNDKANKCLQEFHQANKEPSSNNIKGNHPRATDNLQHGRINTTTQHHSNTSQSKWCKPRARIIKVNYDANLMHDRKYGFGCGVPR